MRKWVPPALLVLIATGMVVLEIWIAIDPRMEEHPLRQIYYNIEMNPVFDLVVTIGFGYLMYILGQREG